MDKLNNLYRFKMIVSPNKQTNLQKMAVKQIKADGATGNRAHRECRHTFHYRHRFAFNIVLIIKFLFSSGVIKSKTLVDFHSFNLTSGVSGLLLLQHLPNSCSCIYFFKMMSQTMKYHG